MEQNLKGKDPWTSRGHQSHSYSRALRQEPQAVWATEQGAGSRGVTGNKGQIMLALWLCSQTLLLL